MFHINYIMKVKPQNTYVCVHDMCVGSGTQMCQSVQMDID